MGVFGGIIVGLGVAALHNRFYKIQLPDSLSFFSGTRFVPIISTVVFVFVGIVMYYVWPPVQYGIYALGGLVTGTGYVGTLIFGLIKRSLIPFGLHHVFYLPFWQTAVGGTMMVDGHLVQGGQNIFFAQLASPDVKHFSSDATRYFSGEFIFMIFGLPGAALAMYRTAKPKNKKIVGGLLLSAALTSILTGITEPIEFSFLFVAPVLFYVHVVLAAFAYMIAHILNIAVGLTFSGGILDLVMFGVLQGNDKTSWLYIIPVGIVYFFLYYFIFTFLIKKFNYKTPGREDDNEEIKLYTKDDVVAKREGGASKEHGAPSSDAVSEAIAIGLGGGSNITTVDACATRLRCSVADPSKVDQNALKRTGAVGVIVKGQGVQVVYGPKVALIKTNLEDYLKANPTGGDAQVAANQGNSVNAEVETPEAVETVAELTDQVDKKTLLYSPFTGVVHPITEAPDEAFASKMTGDGYFVTPTSGDVLAPTDGEVGFVFDTKHAIGMMSDDGVEYLLHIGIDTVNLGGKGFEVFVSNGQKVRRGDKLMSFDMEYVKANAPSDACLVIFTNLIPGQEVQLEANGAVNALDEIAYIK